ncbi:hypothetical protein BJF78_19585 [Pseudonocardia sp. CNS-139]|nr:hypothetical protein BJF78_19585 [Pseudonocardia sp. CNS-139]
MFEYVRNEFNPDPALVLGGTPRPAGRFVVDIPYSVSLVLPIPRTAADLRALRSRKYWSKLRRSEKLLAEDGVKLDFAVLRDEPGLRPALDEVQRLFARRWADEYTSFGWKTPAGFAPYATAMQELAASGRGELVTLRDGDRLVSFAYCLVQDRTYFFYQHASVPDERYRRHSIGKILVARLLADLVEHRRADVLDLMTGAADYKREWTDAEQPILRRISADRSPAGAVRLGLRWALVRARFAVQFGDPRVRSAAKALLLTVDRLRHPAEITRTP